MTAWPDSWKAANRRWALRLMASGACLAQIHGLKSALRLSHTQRVSNLASGNQRDRCLVTPVSDPAQIPCDSRRGRYSAERGCDEIAAGASSDSFKHKEPACVSRIQISGGAARRGHHTCVDKPQR